MTPARIPSPRTSIPIDRARVRRAALVGAGMVRSGIPLDEACALAATARDVPASEQVAVRVAVESLVAAGGDA